MLTIHTAQMKVLHDAAQKRTMALMAEWIQTHHPEVARELPFETVLDRVRLGTARAAAHGITYETGGLLPFLVLMFLAAPNFDDHPVVLRTLRDESLPAGERVVALSERVEACHWREVDERWDEAIWKRLVPLRVDDDEEE